MTIVTENKITELKAELDKFLNVYSEKKRSFIEFKRSYEKFQRKFSSEIGQKQVELNRLNEEINNISIKKVTYSYKVKKEGPGFETKRERSTDTYEDVAIKGPKKIFTVQEIKDAKKVYRKIASVIHPDKAKDDVSRPFRTKLMAELNAAYERKDTTKMHQILKHWQESPESIAGEDFEAELIRIQRAIGQIKNNIVEIEIETSNIISSDIYLLMIKVDEGNIRGKDILKEMTIALDTQIQNAKNQLLLKIYG